MRDPSNHAGFGRKGFEKPEMIQMWKNRGIDVTYQRLFSGVSSDRSIRLFHSRTFRDFGEERDLLVKRVFPTPRARLKDRFIELVDVNSGSIVIELR